jgi:hypothetical protein
VLPCIAGIGLLNCTGSPTPPTNAKPFTCVGGTACSTTCNAGYSLTAGNLTAVCINGTVPVWSVVTGVCSPASELRVQLVVTNWWMLAASPCVERVACGRLSAVTLCMGTLGVRHV